MPAYNAEAYLTQSVESILGQTFLDFELIVVDDCSTDGTLALLRSYNDPRLRIVPNERNMGVVGARNRAMAVARGDLIAAFDADDVSLPTRLAKQVAYLDSHPAVALVGTGSFYLEHGQIRAGKRIANPTPMLLRWLMHVDNPLGHPTLMYRASVVRRLGALLLEDYKYAEDFEFSHRVLTMGEIGYIDEPLILYRRHAGAITVRNEAEVRAQSHRVLTRAYTPWFGDEAAGIASIVNNRLLSRRPVGSADELQSLGAVLTRLSTAFLETNQTTPGERDAILAHAGALWWGAVRAGVRAGRIKALLADPPTIARAQRHHFSGLEAAVSTGSGLVPFKDRLKQALSTRASHTPHAARPLRVGAATFRPAPVAMERPPTLYVVVDTEAEFDWSAPFDRQQTAVTAMASIQRGQDVFDRYGLRPVYVTDFAVASQPGGIRPLQAIHDRGGCEIGAHLHPWITPPFDETLSVRNSYAGNLPAELEERKLVTLLDTFREHFGFSPQFFKTGRYGIGPNTYRLLAEHGIDVDFSVIPGRDLSATGGPDFRNFTADAMITSDGALLLVPMTRGPIGLLARQAPGLSRYLESGAARRFSLPGLFSHLRLLETVTLTPEGMPADKQIALIRAMIARRERHFVLHYHSPSLAPGFTPYARDASEVETLLDRMREVCRVFFEELGGMPGNPKDLLPRERRRVEPLVGATVSRWEVAPAPI